MKTRILIFYDHFYPSYKAGGPTQSLVNLIRSLKDEYSFYVVCKPHERGELTTLKGININEWNNWENIAHVYYWQYGWGRKNELNIILEAVKPDTIYINGIYSLFFNLLPLWSSIRYKKKNKHTRIVLAARGMLHMGALSQKQLKKVPYLFLFRILRFQNKVCWHATDLREAEYIRTAMGNKIEVKIAANFPNLLPVINGPEKKENELYLGTVALISPMKNHDAVLKALNEIHTKVHWYIYGPVKDEAYWNFCQEQIKRLPANIHVCYMGELVPTRLPEAMRQFQVFIMPSKSENYGHAIIEALSAGKPVITTTTTPFTDLSENNCGIAVDPANLTEGLQHCISTYATMLSQQFADEISNTTYYLQKKIDAAQLRLAYKELFN